MEKDWQVFPWDGRETFVLETIPQLVALKPGLPLTVYQYAAYYASRPASLCDWLRISGRLAELAEMERVLPTAKAFAPEDSIRPGEIRRSLTERNVIDWNVNIDAVTLGRNGKGEIEDADLLLILMLSLDAAEAESRDMGRGRAI